MELAKGWRRSSSSICRFRNSMLRYLIHNHMNRLRTGEYLLKGTFSINWRGITTLQEERRRLKCELQSKGQIESLRRTTTGFIFYLSIYFKSLFLSHSWTTLFPSFSQERVSSLNIVNILLWRDHRSTTTHRGWGQLRRCSRCLRMLSRSIDLIFSITCPISVYLL